MKGSKKIDGFFSDKVVDFVVVEFAEAVDDFGMYAGFFVNLAQRGLLSVSPYSMCPFGKPMWPEMLVIKMYFRTPSSSVYKTAPQLFS